MGGLTPPLNATDRKNTMDTDRIDILSVLSRSGLHQREMADYLGVSRPTFSKWCNAKSSVHFHLRDRVDQKLRVIESLIQSGDLPMRVPPRNKERPRLLTELLASVSDKV